MATLVLTAVGTAIGGPVGGAIGAMIGQSIDSATWMKPRGRQGPRLTDLAVQTSSYGTQVPKLFGTVRVAGTVIWATDLIETRGRSGGGKGQASVSTYSYSVSFAVLLSARGIRDVRRIWADGKLLRGAAGDFKVRTGFRLYHGGEDQMADPLIASAEGAAMTPAHRGCAYAVFEGLPLAEFGNRIPSLTFEVVADDGAVSVGAIASALCDRVTGEAGMPLTGFAASGGSVRAVLDLLGTASGAAFVPVGDGLAMRDAGAATRVVADAGVGGGRRVRAVTPIAATPRSVTVVHYDPARDYQTGLQRARRPGAGERDERLDLPAVIDAGAAKTIAGAMLARAEARRTVRTVAAGFDAFDVVPGDCVTIGGEAGRWRVIDVGIEGMATTLRLSPVEPATLPARADPGRPLPAPDRPVGATVIEVFETPALDDAVLAAPRLSIAAAGGAGWRRAALLYSLDDGASWIEAGGTAAPAVIGRVETVAEAAPATLYDMKGGFVVRLGHDAMVLGDADDPALDRGANAAMIGEEIVQFGRATPLGGGRWRLTRLLRGRRGTEAATGAQRAGDRFVLLEAAAIRTLDLPAAMLGRTVTVMASGVGDDDPVIAACVVGGRSVLPPALVHLRCERRGDGSARLRWVRRSRAGWRWSDRVDAPLAEEREAYRVTVGGETIDVGTAGVELAAVPAGASVSVVQRGTLGESAGASIVIG